MMTTRSYDKDSIYDHIDRYSTTSNPNEYPTFLLTKSPS